nr:WcaI family glycosyltransferase [uncultured Arsenicibacter sp.]
MRLLIYGINYAPELTGIGKYTADMSAWLAQHGHEVDVITAMPYYPEWDVHKSYKGKWWQTEVMDGVRVHRSALYIPKRVSALKRIAHEFSFVASSLPHWFRAFFRKRADAVICVVPAFHLGFIPLLYAWLRRVPVVYHVQDLQVDMAKNLGMLSNRQFLACLYRAEKFILDRCELVSTISEGMMARIQAKGVPASRCTLLPNWVDERQVKPLPVSQSLRKAFGLSHNDEVVLYAGSLGEKQGLEQIIEVAGRLRHLPLLKFVIVGTGGAREKLMERVAAEQLTNVLFFPLQPYEKLSALLATADLHVILQKKSASDLVLPSKLTSILAAGGCPLVTASPGTILHDIITRHKVGVVVEAECVDALEKGIVQALASDLSVKRTNARLYAERYLSREAIMKQFERDLLKLTRKLVDKPVARYPKVVPEPGQ